MKTAHSLVAAIVVASSTSVRGQPSDRINTDDLMGRGVVVETRLEHTYRTLSDLVGIGDFDGDGFSDFALVAKDRRDSEHLAYLVHGRSDFSETKRLGSLEGVTTFSAEDGQAPGRVQIHSVGDLNGDGLAELALAAQLRHDGGDRVSYMFVTYGDAGWIPGDYFFRDVGSLIPGVRFYSSVRNVRLSASLDADFGPIGDINDDGAEDLAVPVWGEGGTPSQIRVLYGARELPSEVDISRIGFTIPGVIIMLGVAGSPGAAKALGDFDGDGIDDLAVSDGLDVWVVLGRDDLPRVVDLRDSGNVEAVIFFERSTANQRLEFGRGGQVLGIGDVNGDGLGDLLLGAAACGIDFGGGDALRSEAHLFYGATNFPRVVHMAEIQAGLGTEIIDPNGGFSQSCFASQLAAVGDINLDGVPDLLIGARTADNSAGAAYLVYGQWDFGPLLDLARPFEGIHVTGFTPGAALGGRVSAGGDINGDGAPDFLVGATVQGSPEAQRGRAYILFGTGTEPTPLSVDRISPDNGPVSGGTEVRVLGSGFDGQATVRFGGIQGDAILVTASELKAVAPPREETGPVDVTVTSGNASQTLRRAFVYTPSFPAIDPGQPASLGLRLEGDSDHRSGISTALGDVTGDGTDDVLVGSSSADPSGWEVTLVPGSSDLSGTRQLFDESNTRLFRATSEPPTFGRVVFLGDVNGDSVGDFATSANESIGYLVLGEAGLSQGQKIALEGINGRIVELIPDASRSTDFNGIGFARLGDLDGDGLGDLAVALSFSVEDPGRITVLAGRREWPSSLDLETEDRVLFRIDADELLPSAGSFASTLARAGDVDGDGRSDIVANTGSSPRAYIIYLRTGFPQRADISALVRDGLATEIQRVAREADATMLVSVSKAWRGGRSPDTAQNSERREPLRERTVICVAQT